MKSKIGMLVSMLLLIAQCSSNSGGSGGSGGLGGGNNGFGGGNGGGTDSTKSAKSLIDISGSWSGTGTFSFNGTTGPCEKVEFEFEQSSLKVKIAKGIYQCGQQSSEWDVLEADIKGNDLLIGGQKLGTLSAEKLIIEYKNEEGSSKVTIQRKSGTSQLTISEKHSFQQGSLELSGQLNRQ